MEEKKLDYLRHASLCNISLCFLKMGYLREAEDRASQVRSRDTNMTSLKLLLGDP
jgi:hypothetical protein